MLPRKKARATSAVSCLCWVINTATLGTHMEKPSFPLGNRKQKIER
jgi:hypothetical protein